MAQRALGPDGLGTCAESIGALFRGDDSYEADAGAIVLAAFLRSFTTGGRKG